MQDGRCGADHQLRRHSQSYSKRQDRGAQGCPCSERRRHSRESGHFRRVMASRSFAMATRCSAYLPDEGSRCSLKNGMIKAHCYSSTLPSTVIFALAMNTMFLVVREERVAGRKAVMLAIRPHDEYRYGHRIWLDIANGLPAANQAGAAMMARPSSRSSSLISASGSGNPLASALAPSIEYRGFSLVYPTTAQDYSYRCQQSLGHSGELPVGFSCQFRFTKKNCRAGKRPSHSYSLQRRSGECFGIH